MKKYYLLIILIFLSSFCYSQTTIKVKDVKEFIKAIASNTTIELISGTYNLSTAMDIKNPNIIWEETDGDFGPVISNVKNLIVKGEDNVKIVINMEYSNVFSFRRCSNIKFENLSIGHLKIGYCTGGVLYFKNTDSILIKNCDLYGSGAYGLELDNVNYFVFNNSVIRKCTEYLMVIDDSRNLFFKKSEFKETEYKNLIQINDYTENVFFNNCTIHNNSTDSNYFKYLFDIQKSCKNIRVKNCEINNNYVKEFVNDESLIIQKDNTFSGNTFKK